MKKLTLILVWVLITGWTIFAIQSYASSLDRLPTEAEIIALKSTNNQNRLTTQMWDKMLDLLNRTREKITKNNSDSSNFWSSQSIINIDWPITSACNGKQLPCATTGDEIPSQVIPLIIMESKQSFFNKWTNPVNFPDIDRQTDPYRGNDTNSKYLAKALPRLVNARNNITDERTKYDTYEYNSPERYLSWLNVAITSTTERIKGVNGKDLFTFCALTTVASKWDQHICHVYPSST